MDKAEKDKLYDRLSEEDDMTDSERREAYFAEIENAQAEEDRQDGY